MEIKDELVALLIDAAEDIKALDIQVYDVSTTSSIVDFYVLCSGTSHVQINAITRSIVDRVKAENIEYRVDGHKGNKWMVIDVGNVMVHVMSEEERAKYDLDDLWNKDSIIYH